jgi:hypothetical protein
MAKFHQAAVRSFRSFRRRRRLDRDGLTEWRFWTQMSRLRPLQTLAAVT